MLSRPANISYISVSQTSLLSELLWFLKTTTDPHILNHVHIECVDERCPKLEICIPEQILDR